MIFPEQVFPNNHFFGSFSSVAFSFYFSSATAIVYQRWDTVRKHRMEG